MRFQGTRLIAGQSSGTHGQSHGRLGVAVEGERPASGFSRVGEAAPAFDEECLAESHEHRCRLGVQSGAFCGGPVFELRRILDSEPVEEITAQEVECVGKLGWSKAGQAQRVDLQALRTEGNGVAQGLQASLAQTATQAVDRLVQRVAGSGFVLVGPENAENLVPGSTVLRSQGEIDEKGQVLTPEDLGRRLPALEPGGGRPEADKREATEMGRALHTIPNMRHSFGPSRYNDIGASVLTTFAI